MKKSKREITIDEVIEQTFAAILTEFMFCNSMDEVHEVWDKLYKLANLELDPFTKTPCTQKEYAEYCAEYDRQRGGVE